MRPEREHLSNTTAVLNLREQSELIKLYSKRILDLGMHKVPSPSVAFPAFSLRRSATKECLGIRAQTTN